MLTDAFGRFAHGMIRTLSGAALSKGLIGVKETYVQEKKKVTKKFLGQICTTVSGLNHINGRLLLGGSGRAVNSLDFCPAVLSPLAAFTSCAYFLHNGRQ